MKFLQHKLVLGGIKLLSIVCTHFFLVACYPVKSTFFKPSAKNGHITKVACKGHVGYPNYINFEYERVHIMIGASIEPDSLEPHTLTFIFRIPPNVSVSFPSGQFILSQGGKDYFLWPKSIQGYDLHDKFHPRIVEFPIEEWQVLEGVKFVFDGKHSIYWVHINLKGLFTIKGADTFTLDIPQFVINEKKVKVPSIKFTLQSGWYIYPLNC